MCATEAGKRGRRVAVLEHADKVGKKILISGGAARSEFLVQMLQAELGVVCKAWFPTEGMKLALARAIINDPPNIILDEPANGLDVASARALRTLLERFRDAGKCVLLSSHLMAEVAAVCNTVVVVARGKVVAQGSPAELMRSSNARSLEEAFVELTA